MVDEIIFKPKRPTTRDNYIGIEIECLMTPGDRQMFINYINSYSLQWNVQLSDDGSIKDLKWKPIIETRNGMFGPYKKITNEHLQDMGCEIKILATEREAPNYINDVCDLLKQCNAYINRTCGLHVHIDMRNRDKDTVFKNLLSNQDTMFNMIPKARRKSKYCKPIKRSNENGDRYKSINVKAYNEHRTIEVRLHEGTIDPIEIRKWCGFLLAACNNNFNAKVEEYINDRKSRYA